jgi:hypothetical protein
MSMNNAKRVWMMMALVCVAGIAQAARPPEPVYDKEVQIVTASGKEPTMDTVRKAIMAGAVSKGWTIKEEGSGKIRLDLDVRNKHQVVAEVVYTTKMYVVKYLTSTNMGHKEEGGVKFVHPNYVKWVNDLVNNINAQLINQ